MSLQKEVIHENRSEHCDSANDYDEQQDYLCFDADGNLNIQSCGSTIQVSTYVALWVEYYIFICVYVYV